MLLSYLFIFYYFFLPKVDFFKFMISENKFCFFSLRDSKMNYLYFFCRSSVPLPPPQKKPSGRSYVI